MKFLKRSYVFLVYFLLYAPIAVLILYSFNENVRRSKFTGFSLKWYADIFQNRNILNALYYTLLCALIASVLATVIGTVTAIGIHHMRKGPKSFIMNLSYIPMLNPDIVTGVSLMLLFVFANMQLGFTTMLLAHLTFDIPYVIVSVLPKLKQLNPHLYEAAVDLGANPFLAYWKIVIPQIWPGVVTGFLFAITMSIDDFVISFFTTGNGVQNLSILIYNSTKTGVKTNINALSTLMFVVMLVLLLIINNRGSEDKNIQKAKK